MESIPNHNLLEVKNLKIHFPILRGLFKKKVAEVKAVDGVSFHIRRGETLGLVGESGCGKTTTGRGVARLCEPTAGQVFFQGHNILQLAPAKMKSLRRNMSIIFQDPYGSLDPRQTAGDIVGEPLLTHQMVHNKAEYKETVEGLFKKVGLDPFMIQRVPHEFSGGQRQRIGIARALACKPSLVICDEPISALDVSIQAQIINLFKKLQEDMEGLTYFFIAHDLSVVKHISDRIAVMYLGRIVEITHSDDLYHNPLHPYTKALLSAVPIADPLVEKKRERIFLRGEVPSPLNPPAGCSFHPRCNQAMKKCSQEAPALRSVGNGHEVSCHLV